MKRILFFITGFILIYVLSVVILNLLPEPSPQEPTPEAPEIQIQQPQETATPSAQQDLVQPDL